MIDIYRRYREFAERKGLPWIEPAPLVNEVDHRAFNYSLEEPILREFGSYENIDHIYNFSTVQPCIRSADVARIKRGYTNNHLDLFHICPLSFWMLPDSNKLENYNRRSIFDAIEFLTEVGISIDDLRVTCFGGGNLKRFSRGKIPVDKWFPKDESTYQSFIEAGLKKSQIISTASLDTFVATFSGYGNFFAGYRYELYCPLKNGSLIEIGTGEAFKYWQLRRGGRTVDVIPCEKGAAPFVIGLERLQAIVEKAENVQEVSNVRVLADLIFPILSNGYARDLALRAASLFRAVHILFTQNRKKELTHSQRRQQRAIVSGFCRLISDNLREEDIVNLLKTNAKMMYWHKALSCDHDEVLELILNNIERRKNVRFIS